MSRKGMFVCIILLLFAFISISGCGSGDDSIVSADGSYTVYVDSGSMSAKAGGVSAQAAGNSPDIVVVLPSDANAPVNYSAVSNANVTFIQQEETSEGDAGSDAITITAGADGGFRIPDDLATTLQGEGGSVDVSVSLPAGEGLPLFTTLPLAQSDTGETAMSLMAVPSDFTMALGETRVFHAIKMTSSDKPVIAKNVTWDCDPQGTGAMSFVASGSNGGYVICRAEVAGAAGVSASINAAGGLKDTARGAIFDPANAIEISGIVNAQDGTVVDDGYLVSFITNSTVRQRPLHFAGITNASGVYRTFLPPSPDQTDYGVLIGTPRAQDARFYKAIPFVYSVSSIDNGTSISGADFTIGDSLPPLRARLRVARIIRAAWHQVGMAVVPKYFEPMHGVRLMFDISGDAQGQLPAAGLFRNWCYAKQGDMVSLTPPTLALSCPNALALQKIEMTKVNTYQYTWDKYIVIPGLTGMIQVAAGTVDDTVTSIGGGSYISAIDSIDRFVAPTLLGPVLMTNKWQWTRTLGGDVGLDVEVPERTTLTAQTCLGDSVWTGADYTSACASGLPLLDYSATRTRAADFVDFSSVTGLFDFSGTSSAYFKRLDGAFRVIVSDICSEISPCYVNTDGSGLANVASYDGTRSAENELSRVSFDIQPLLVSSDMATGTLTLKVRAFDGTVSDLVFGFTIAPNGLITVTRPDGATASFMLPQS